MSVFRLQMQYPANHAEIILLLSLQEQRSMLPTFDSARNVILEVFELSLGLIVLAFKTLHLRPGQLGHICALGAPERRDLAVWHHFRSYEELGSSWHGPTALFDHQVALESFHMRSG